MPEYQVGKILTDLGLKVLLLLFVFISRVELSILCKILKQKVYLSTCLGSASESTSGYGSQDTSSRNVRQNRVESWIMDQQQQNTGPVYNGVVSHASHIVSNANLNVPHTSSHYVPHATQSVPHTSGHTVPQTSGYSMPHTSVHNVLQTSGHVVHSSGHVVTHSNGFGMPSTAFSVPHLLGQATEAQGTVYSIEATSSNNFMGNSVLQSSVTMPSIATTSSNLSSAFNLVHGPRRVVGEMPNAVRPPVPLFSMWGCEGAQNMTVVGENEASVQAALSQSASWPL